MPLINISNKNNQKAQPPIQSTTPVAITANPQPAQVTPTVDPSVVEFKNNQTNQQQTAQQTAQQTTPAKNTSIDDIVSQVQQVVGNDQKQEVTAVKNENNQPQQPATSDTVQFSSSESDSSIGSGASTLQLGSNVNVSQNGGTREIKPVEQPMVNQKVQDPSANLDQKLNNITQAVQTQPNLQEDPQLTKKTYTLDEYFQEGIKQGASDVHISPGYRVMLRVNGELKAMQSPIINENDSKGFVEQLIKNRKVKIEDLFEYDMTYSMGARRFRINIFREMTKYSIAARIISEEIPTVEQLELPPIMKEFAKYPNGLVLVTGPTGSGKSTTIASLINLVNLTETKHIITLEDPVEYVFPKALSLVDQREFGQDFQAWSDALRAILRQDPNIVLVGEMRDLETVEAALRIAETGHLVFATLHTNGASQTVDRIIDMFPAEKQEQVKVQLASVLQVVISQRLLKTINNSRVAALELLIGTSAVRNTIRESKGVQLDNIIQTSADLGMISMEKSLVQLVKSGKVSTEVAKAVANRPNDFDILLNKG